MHSLDKLERKAWLALNKYVFLYLPRTFAPVSYTHSEPTRPY